MMTLEEFRNGIFALKTRRFGNVAEIMIKKIYKLEESKKLEFDKFDAANKKRIEIKFSTVLKENENKINEKNILEEIEKANFSIRAMKFKEIAKKSFDSNIQQIKCKEFDLLYYGLFFADYIYIFCMTSDQVKKCKGYSNKQHRGNKGEGQFHLNNDTIKYHIENHLVKKMNYRQLYNIFK